MDTPTTASRGIAVLGLIASALIGLACAGDPPARVTVRFWAMGAEGENVQTLLPEFERQHPDIDVELQAIPWTAAHEKLLTAFAGDALPDIWQLGNTWIPEFELLGALEDLGPWDLRSPAIDSAGYFRGIWETNLVGGKLLGIPWYVDTRVLFYRSDIFRAAGAANPPRTWEEWVDLARRIKQLGGDRETYAILLPTNEFTPPLVLGLQTGATFLRDQNTRGDFSSPEFRRAFTFYTAFFEEGLAPVGVTRVTNIYQGLAEGFFAMYITGPWNLGEFRRRLPDSLQAHWATAPLPSPDGRYPGASIAGGSSLVMSHTSRCKDQVWALIEYLSDPAQQIAFYRATGNLPARTEAWGDSALREDQKIQAFYEQLGNVRATPAVPEWERIMMRLQDFAELTSRQEQPVDDLLDALDREADWILEKRRWLIHER